MTINVILAALALVLLFALLPVVLSVYGRWWDRWMGVGMFLEFMMPRA